MCIKMQSLSYQERGTLHLFKHFGLQKKRLDYHFASGDGALKSTARFKTVKP